MKKKYSIAEARHNLSALVHEAERTGTVCITRRGQVVARLVAEHEYQRLARRKHRIDWGTMLIAQQMEEFEYTCDPSRLQNIEVLECFPKL